VAGTGAGLGEGTLLPRDGTHTPCTPLQSPPRNGSPRRVGRTWNVAPQGAGPAGGGRTEPGARDDACGRAGRIRLYLSAGCLLAEEAEARLDLIRHNDKNGPTVAEKASTAKY